MASILSELAWDSAMTTQLTWGLEKETLQLELSLQLDRIRPSSPTPKKIKITTPSGYNVVGRLVSLSLCIIFHISDSHPPKATNRVSSEISPKVEEARSEWGNQFQFILTAIGLAVGLGNIWRFPTVAYAHGGAAFLIAYIICSLIFGLPMVYAEFMIGQYSRSGPGLAFGRYAAGFRGIGWTMAINALCVAIYYGLLIAWVCIYLVWVFSGKSSQWTECGNVWNSIHCTSKRLIDGCQLQNQYFYNESCHPTMNLLNDTKGAAEEFFNLYITQQSAGVADFGDFNLPVLGALVFMWIFTAAILTKGITIMGYLSYIIVPFPYIIIVILFFRGITLDGAAEGFKFYMLDPKWEKLWNPSTWAAAMKQLMFSMNIGYGGLVSLSSYSKRSNNFFRDSLIVIIGDTLMSLIGGVAVFTTLGYLAKMAHKPIEEVVASGTSLAFIVYPEAISTMSFPWLWNALFFLMLFFLGVSSEVALVETFTGTIVDCFPSMKKKKWIVSIATCGFCQAVALIMATKAGFYWFSVFDNFTGLASTCMVAVVEVLLLTFYGWKMVKGDLVEMWGVQKAKSWLNFVGKRSPFFGASWAFICPIFAVIIMVAQLMGNFHFTLTEKDKVVYTYPVWASLFGWSLSFGPLIPIFVFFFYKWYSYRKEGISFHYLFRPTAGLPSYDRYYEKRGVPPPGSTAKQPPALVASNKGSHSPEMSESSHIRF